MFEINNSENQEAEYKEIPTPANIPPNIQPKQEKKKTSSWKATVLIIDDQASIRDVTKIMLKTHGFSAITAKDGLDGISIFMEYIDYIDAVLLDMEMPNLNGEEVFHELVKIKSDIPIIFASGYSDLATTNKIIAGGFAGFIRKPYRTDELINKITSALEDNKGNNQPSLDNL